jgi:Tfp pilus assembly protein PilN
MIRINLFPIQEIRRNYELKLTLFWNIAVFIFIAVFISGIFYVNHLKIVKIEQEISYNKKKLQKLRMLRIQLKKFKRDKAILQTKFKIIKELESVKLLPAFIVELFSQKMPEKAWLGSLTYDNGIMYVSGVAIDEPTIVELMDRLKKSGYFSSIELVQVNRKVISGYHFKSFIMDLKVNYKKMKDIL